MSYVLDTNIFNLLLDEKISPLDLPSDESYFATHLQIDEIKKTNHTLRRDNLLSKFEEINPKILPTETCIWDISHWDHAKWSDGKLFTELKNALDLRNKSKKNNPIDALIGETCIFNAYTLITADNDLSTVVKEYGGKVLFFRP